MKKTIIILILIFICTLLIQPYQVNVYKLNSYYNNKKDIIEQSEKVKNYIEFGFIINPPKTDFIFTKKETTNSYNNYEAYYVVKYIHLHTLISLIFLELILLLISIFIYIKK